MQSQPLERRAHVRVKMKLVLKLKGGDESKRSFEQLTATENVSAGGFLCSLPLALSTNSALDVFLCGSHDRYVGKVRAVRREAPGAPWQRYAFQFIERSPEWILQE
jgi:hypothetical protein